MEKFEVINKDKNLVMDFVKPVSYHVTLCDDWSCTQTILVVNVETENERFYWRFFFEEGYFDEDLDNIWKARNYFEYKLKSGKVIIDGERLNLSIVRVNEEVLGNVLTIKACEFERIEK